MAKLYEVVAATGEYTDKNGETKVRWMNCGVVVETEKGLSLKLEALPVGEWNGWFKLFTPKAKGEQAPRPKQADPDDFENSEIPF